MTEPSSPTPSPTETPSPTPTTPQTSSPETPSTTPPPATSLLDPTAKPTDPAKPVAEPKPGDKPVVPETYAAFKVPEGFKLEDAAPSDANTLFKKLGLTQDQAQKAIDLYAKYAQDSQAQSLKSLRETRDGWVAEAKQKFGNAVEPGGKIVVGMSKMLESIGDAKLASDFRQVMNLTGAGDHPAFIGVFNWLIDKFGEGTQVNGKGASPFGQTAPGGGRKSTAQEIYPTLS